MSFNVRMLFLISVLFKADSASSLCLKVLCSTSSGSRSFCFFAWFYWIWSPLTTYSWFSFMMPLA